MPVDTLVIAPKVVVLVLVKTVLKKCSELPPSKVSSRVPGFYLQPSAECNSSRVKPASDTRGAKTRESRSGNSPRLVFGYLPASRQS